MAKDRLSDWLPETLCCLLSFDKQTSRWVGKCLDLGLTTSGKTDKAAWENLTKVVKAHVETCWRRNREALVKNRAPDAEFDLFKHLGEKEPGRRDKITFDLIEPENEIGPLWIEGLEFLPQGTGCETAGPAIQAVH